MANGVYELDEADEADETYWREAFEADEGLEPEAPSFRRALRPASPRRSYVPAQTTSNYVTQTQLQTALAGVRSDMQKNATAIRAAAAQISTVGKRVTTETTKLRDESRNTTQMLALIPLLTQSKPLDAPTSNVNISDVDGGTFEIPAGTKIATASDGLAAMLPLLLVSGGFGPSGGTSGSGMDNNMMMLVMAMMLMDRGKN